MKLPSRRARIALLAGCATFAAAAPASDVHAEYKTDHGRARHHPSGAESITVTCDANSRC